MSRLKPLPKFAILAAVVGGALWAANTFYFSKTHGGTTVPSATPSSALGALSLGNSDALKVSIVSFHGYAPGLLANGGSLTTRSGSIFDSVGAKIQFVLQDNVPTLTEIFTSGAAQCAWRTSDFWAQEQPNLRNSKLDGKAVMIVDNTRGGDAIIARDASVQSVEDLAGKSVAMLQFTPSHGLFIAALDSSTLTPKKKQSVRPVFINADEGTSGVRAAFTAGKVDAAVLWDPDLSLALKAGGHVVYSTKIAQDLIYDVMVCDSRTLADPAGRAKVEKFVAGWMEGVKAARANPDAAVAALVDTEEMFKLLAKEQGAGFIKGLFQNVMWTGLEDNARILGLAGGTNFYERVYSQFDQVYRTAGALANPASPVISPQASFDYDFIKTLLAKDGSAIAAANRDTTNFTTTGAAAATKVVLTKPISINFDVGSAELSAKAKKTIDTDLIPFIEANGSAYIELSGHTDSTGATGTNLALSTRRARAVADYVIGQWEIKPDRLKVVGRGSGNPICVEPGTNDGLTLDECRALNRTTRVALLTK